MLLCDVNVLVAAHRPDHPHHTAALPWLQEAVNGLEAVVVPDVVASGFVRVVTHARVFEVPTPLDEAFGFLHELTRGPAVVAMPPVDGLVDRLDAVCRDADARGSLVSDALLATYAVALGARLVTFDRDFRRFDGLMVVELRA